MDKELINMIEAANELNLYAKIVTSTMNYENYNSFFNIYDIWEEPCRRIAVLTPYKDLEEVYDNEPDKEIQKNCIIDGNVWIKEFPLTTNPDNIDLTSINISREVFEELKLKITNIVK